MTGGQPFTNPTTLEPEEPRSGAAVVVVQKLELRRIWSFVLRSIVIYSFGALLPSGI